MDSYADSLIRAIRSSLRSLPDDIFDSAILETIRRLASFVHDLPGSRVHHHLEPFGLFTHSLETAYWTARRRFPREARSGAAGPDHRARLLARRVAAVGLAVVHDTGKALKVTVTDARTGEVWVPSRHGLAEFAELHPDRALDWRGYAALAHDQTLLLEHRWILDLLCPPELNALISRRTPWPDLAALLADPDPEARAIRGMVAAADSSSQHDDVNGRNPIKIAAFRTRLRELARNPDTVIPPLRAAAIPVTPARHAPWVALLIRLAVARAHVNSAIMEHVDRFREVVKPRPYGPFLRSMGRPQRARSGSGHATLAVGWGSYPSPAERARGHVPFTTPRLSTRRVVQANHLARYVPVFQAADAFFESLHAHATGISRRLNHVRGRLHLYPTAPIPPALRGFLHATLEALPVRTGIAPDAENSVGRLLTLLQRLEDALHDADRFINGHRADGQDPEHSTWPDPKPVACLIRILREEHRLELGIAPHPELPGLHVGPVWTLGVHVMPLSTHISVRRARSEFGLPKYWARLMPRIELPRLRLFASVLLHAETLRFLALQPRLPESSGAHTRGSA